MYGMVYKKPNLVHMVSVVNNFMKNLGCCHCRGNVDTRKFLGMFLLGLSREDRWGDTTPMRH